MSNDPHMIEAVLRLFEYGFDTKRIATVLNQKEADVERWLHLALDQKRNARANNVSDLVR